MPSLSDQLLAPSVYEALVADCHALVDNEIASRGMTVRAALNLAQRAKPNLLDRGVRALLPDLARALDPFYAEYLDHGRETFGEYLLACKEKTVKALLAVTDARVAEVSNKTVRTGYQRLRSQGEREVRASLPAIADVISRHLHASSQQH